jgi:hypothetical protein
MPTETDLASLRQDTLVGLGLSIGWVASASYEADDPDASVSVGDEPRGVRGLSETDFGAETWKSANSNSCGFIIDLKSPTAGGRPSRQVRCCVNSPVRMRQAVSICSGKK